MSAAWRRDKACVGEGLWAEMILPSAPSVKG